jgi:glycosyltransferase involved in cell wall biosynthesis
MKICFLAHAFSVHTRQWTHYFRDQGHQVGVVSLTPAQPEPGIELHVLPHRWPVRQERANWHYLLRLPQLRAVVRRLQPDLLNAHFLSSYGLLGAIVRPATCPFVISLHGSDILLFPQRSPLHRMAVRFALHRADMVTSVAQHMTAVLPNYLAPGTSVLTLQYGIDTRSFHPPGEGRPRPPLCLSTRKMVPVCNLETVLFAAQALDAADSPIRIHLANDGELYDSLQEAAANLGLGDRVRFLGRIDQARMAAELRTAALYVSMSLSDGASLSLMEAMACGAFPVVSDIPANREWIDDGVNGFLVPPHSARHLARRLDEAWGKPELRQAAAERNWALIREKGDYRKNMAVIESEYTRLVQQARGVG